jgi:hypothetical protein
VCERDGWPQPATRNSMSRFYWGTLDNGNVNLTEGDLFSLLEVLSQEVGVLGVFSCHFLRQYICPLILKDVHYSRNIWLYSINICWCNSSCRC